MVVCVSVLTGCLGGGAPDRLALTNAEVQVVFAPAVAALDVSARSCAIAVLTRESSARHMTVGDSSKRGRGRALAAILTAWDECGLLPPAHRRRSELFQDPLLTVSDKERACLTRSQTGGPTDLSITIAEVAARGRALQDCVFGASRRAGLIAEDLGVATIIGDRRPEAPCVLDHLVQDAGTWRAIMLYRGLFAAQWTDADVQHYVASLDSCGEPPAGDPFDMRAYVRLGRPASARPGQALTSDPATPPGNPVAPTAPPAPTTVDPTF